MPKPISIQTNNQTDTSIVDLMLILVHQSERILHLLDNIERKITAIEEAILDLDQE